MNSFLKKFLVLICICFSKYTFGQSNYSMLSHSSEWHVTYCNNGCITDLYFTNHDTIFNSTIYKVLDGYHFISKTFWLREDITTKQVFMSFVQNAERKEVLLYDFSLNTGDSIIVNNPISPLPSNMGYFHVDSTTTINLNGNNLKMLFLSSNNYSHKPIWVESIGSLSLINTPGGSPDVNGIGKLSCHYDTTNLIYSQLDSIDQCTYGGSIVISSNENEHINNQKKLLEVINILGKGSKTQKNIPLFFIYENGLVEKKIIID